ncbi:hypothetical protein GGX14DRAFT_666932 [Mycena pura]|uniref:Uncharacterized protein n=1 Tax=Mycena pura TaxID=153505 RepID=A0AAD6UZB2_9AGAR|nr:hypothetical protein GGX14DRAFT_666932 [Mycena pura]
MPSFSSVITVCLVFAFCSLSVQGRTVTLFARQMKASNPLSLGPFAPGSTALVTARSNARFTQKVVVTGPPAECTLEGSGEDVDMIVFPTGFFGPGPTGPDGPTDPNDPFGPGPSGPNGPNGPTDPNDPFGLGPSGPNGPTGPTDPANPTDPPFPPSFEFSNQCKFTSATTSDPLSLSLLFQFSPNGFIFTNSPVVNVSTNTIDNVVSVRASSEDSTDNDVNDSEVTITVVLPPDDTAPVQPTNPNTTFPDALVGSAMVFNPTDSIALSVGPFDGDSTQTDFLATTEDWNKVTGEIIDVKQPPPFSNVLLMRFMFDDGTKDELKNSGFLLNGVVTYVRAASFFLSPSQC